MSPLATSLTALHVCKPRVVGADWVAWAFSFLMSFISELAWHHSYHDHRLLVCIACITALKSIHKPLLPPRVVRPFATISPQSMCLPCTFSLVTESLHGFMCVPPWVSLGRPLFPRLSVWCRENTHFLCACLAYFSSSISEVVLIFGGIFLL
jgi:hypothetical protein